MKYLNQLDHPDIPYPTDAATEGSRFHDLSIKEAGCGLCSLAMMVDRLTTKTISLKRLIALSLKHKANLHPGTDMKILGPVVADLYDLDFSTTNSVKKAMQHLKNGGASSPTWAETGKAIPEYFPTAATMSCFYPPERTASVSWIRL